jgi:hypothetical protein
MFTEKQILFLEAYTKSNELQIGTINKLLSGMGSHDLDTLLKVREDIDFIFSDHEVSSTLTVARVRALFAEAISDFRDQQWKCVLSSVRDLIRNDLHYFPIYAFLLGRCYESLKLVGVSELFYSKTLISKIYKWIGNHWVDPYQMSIEEGSNSICLEWSSEDSRLTFYLDEVASEIRYLISDGPSIQTDMKEGEVTEENAVGIFQWILKK